MLFYTLHRCNQKKHQSPPNIRHNLFSNPYIHSNETDLYHKPSHIHMYFLSGKNYHHKQELLCKTDKTSSLQNPTRNLVPFQYHYSYSLIVPNAIFLAPYFSPQVRYPAKPSFTWYPYNISGTFAM